MLRGTNTPHGRYVIYTIVLGSFLGILLTELLHVPYDISVLILIAILAVCLGCMNRFTNWITERRKQRFQQQIAERQKDGNEP